MQVAKVTGAPGCRSLHARYVSCWKKLVLKVKLSAVSEQNMALISFLFYTEKKIKSIFKKRKTCVYKKRSMYVFYSLYSVFSCCPAASVTMLRDRLPIMQLFCGVVANVSRWTKMFWFFFFPSVSFWGKLQMFGICVYFTWMALMNIYLWIGSSCPPRLRVLFGFVPDCHLPEKKKKKSVSSNLPFLFFLVFVARLWPWRKKTVGIKK